MTEKTMHIADVCSGDLLAWSRNPYSSFSDLLIRMIAFATRAPYGHVGIAWRCHDGIGDELIVIEATLPKIQISRATEDRHFYCVPMNVDWQSENKDFLVEKIGLPYGLMDALRAFLGKRLESDEKWQCAELAHAFYNESGIVLPNDFTPGKLIQNAVKFTGSEIYRVIVDA